MCNTEFCAGCKVQPYHLGYTCESHKEYLSSRHCRFCETQLHEGNTAQDIFIDSLRDVCTDKHCNDMREVVCAEDLECGHHCCGMTGEDVHPQCVHKDCLALTGETNENCVICYSKYIYEPTIQLGCKHMFHYDCIKTRINGKWTGSRLNFEFLSCPLCKQDIEHPALYNIMYDYNQLRYKVLHKAMARFKQMKLGDARELTDPESVYFKNPELYVMARFCYYLCFKCKEPYFGGMKECNAEDRQGSFNEKDLICGSCSSKGGNGNGCIKHGNEYVEYKCRFCCNIACWFCWGTTHFCDDCHRIAAEISKRPKNKLPPCTCKIEHPPNGEEFCVGCSICRLESRNERRSEYY